MQKLFRVFSGFSKYNLSYKVLFMIGKDVFLVVKYINK
jgi:hypothetical protein